MSEVYSERVSMLDGDMKCTVVGYRQYGSLVCIKIETDVGMTQEFSLSPEDARSVALKLIDAANAVSK